MTYLVVLPELEMTWNVTFIFTQEDRDSLLAASVGNPVHLEKGVAVLFKDGAIILSLKSHKGIRHYPVNYEELCSQLKYPSE